MVSNLKVDKIQSVAGTTTAMTIASDGKLSFPVSAPLTPARPYFSVYVYNNNAGNPGSGGQGTHLVPFDTAIDNIGGHYDTSNYKFTAPVDGIYQFNWNLSIYDVSSGSWVRQRVYKNGASYQIYEYKYSQTTLDQNFSSSFAYKLLANDVIQFYANSNDANFIYSAGTTWNHCTGYLVG